MTMEEIETLIDDTKHLPRAADKVAQATALGVLEVARQLIIMNAAVAEQSKVAKGKKADVKRAVDPEPGLVAPYTDDVVARMMKIAAREKNENKAAKSRK
jgi:hypothetical protein